MKRKYNVKSAAKLVCVLTLAATLFLQGVSADEIVLPPPGNTEQAPVGYIVNDGTDIYKVDGEGNVYRNEVETLWGTNSSLPATYDLRNVDGKSYVTRPECQYSGNCWAFASIASLESNVMKQGYDKPHFSKTHLTYFAKKPANEGYYYQYPFNSGGNINDTIGALSNLEGIADKSDFPNNLTPGEVTFPESDRYNTGSGYVLDEAVSLENTNEIKSWLMENGAVYAAVLQTELNDGYMFNDSLVWNGSTVDNEKKTNHGITIIGWDDTIPASAFTHTESRYYANGEKADNAPQVTYTPAVNGAWIVKNTVGYIYNGVAQEYYDKNYMYISYGQFIGSAYGLKAMENPGINRNYTYTERIPYSHYSGVFPQFANVFTADAAGKVDSVGFMLAPAKDNKITDVTATFKVYKNLPSDYTSPTDGTCMFTVTKHYTNEGYYTFDFPTKVPVSKGEIFSAVILLHDSKGCSLQIPFEWQSKSDTNPTYTSAARQSYYTFTENAVMKDIYSDVTSCTVGNIFMHVYTTCPHTDTTEAPNSQNANRVDICCSLCGKYIRTECKVHTIVTEKGTPATCLTAGTTDKIYCSECDYVQKKAENIPPLGHIPATDKGYPKTCTEDGLSDGSHCSRCNIVLTEQKPIPKGHNIVVDKGKPATCQQTGLTDGWHCTACDAEEKRVVIPVSNHKDTNTDGLCDDCSTLLDAALHNKYLLDSVSINAPAGGTVDYKNKVSFTASVKGTLPEGFCIAVYDGANEIGRGASSVSVTTGELDAAKTFTVKIIASDGSSALNSAGKEINKTVQVNVKKNIITIIVAFFRSIFGGQPIKNI